VKVLEVRLNLSVGSDVFGPPGSGSVSQSYGSGSGSLTFHL
jgi:hypothetical protein